MTPNRVRISAGSMFMLVVCLVFLTGCATPIGVNRVTPQQSYQDAYANPLNAGVLSNEARWVFNRYDLLEKFNKKPASTLAFLHEKTFQDDRGDILYAIAEGSYIYGGKLAGSDFVKDQRLAPDYFLLSSLFSYYFIKNEHSKQRLNIFDHRVSTAIDMYNFGLWQAFETGETQGLVLKAAERKLPFGKISISVDTSRMPWKLEEFEEFLPADKFAVRGVSVRNRNPGVGLPLIAVREKTDQPIKEKIGQSMPMTVILRVEGGLSALKAGTAQASLDFYATGDTSAKKTQNGIAIPIESDLTTPLAYRMEGSSFFDLSLGAFLGREPNKIPDGLYMTETYRPGKIPVVLVHGTASSPVWWVELLNTLAADPLIREKYQFWFFVYTSNKPIAMSAAELRQALNEKTAVLDPQGKDPAMQQMVIAGHSQGGLLTKFTAVDTGDSLVQALTGKDLASLDIPENKKAQVRRLLVIKPLPFVKTVIFFSTPHRGSFRSKTWNRNLARWLISLPANLVKTTMNVFDYMTDDVKKLMGGEKAVFTSADGMSPDNPLLLTLAETPLGPGIKGHSIIAVQGDGDPTLGDDGVVKYTSAHLDGMASEFIVNSGHSSQLNPLAIDEMRRILVENPAISSPGDPTDEN